MKSTKKEGSVAKFVKYAVAGEVAGIAAASPGIYRYLRLRRGLSKRAPGKTKQVIVKKLMKSKRALNTFQKLGKKTKRAYSIGSLVGPVSYYGYRKYKKK